ncbi:MAG: MFS transporter [Dehalococcoidia bacterium]|nr:MFS transporter [Dehalococcoidia bacterium]
MNESLKSSRIRGILVFAVVAPAMLMSSMDNTIIGIGLPTIMDALHTNIAWIGWVFTAYQLTQTIMMPIAGKVSDEWGQKKVFLWAVVLFVGSSIGVGLSPNVYMVICFRVTQAVGGAAFMPSATGIIADAFGGTRRATAIGLLGSIFPIGVMLGPNLGGFVLEYFSWRWMFFINIPIGMIVLLLAPFILPKDKPVKSKRNIDLAGAGLFAGGIASLLYGMTAWGDNNGSINLLTLVFFGLGASLLVLFWRHIHHTPTPLIEIDLLKRPAFMAANIYNTIYGLGTFGVFAFMPYYIIVEYNMSPRDVGIALTPRLVLIMVSSILTSFLLPKIGYRKPMIIGPILVGISLILLGLSLHNIAILGLDIPDMSLLAFILIFGGVGMGIANPASNNAALDLAPEKIAAITGLRGTIRGAGSVLGISLVTLYLSGVQDRGAGLANVFIATTVLMWVILPVVFLIPDNKPKAKAEKASKEAEQPSRG